MKPYSSVYRKILGYDPLANWTDNTLKNLDTLDDKVKKRLSIFRISEARFFLDTHKLLKDNKFIPPKDNKSDFQVLGKEKDILCWNMQWIMFFPIIATKLIFANYLKHICALFIKKLGLHPFSKPCM